MSSRRFIVVKIQFDLIIELPWSGCDNYWNSDKCLASTYNKTDCYSRFTDGKNVTFCTIEGKGTISLNNVTDPVKEFWE